MRILVIFLIILSSPKHSFLQEVTKVEPPFWWEDMHDSSLMITLYGDDLAAYKVKSKSLKIERFRDD